MASGHIRDKLYALYNISFLKILKSDGYVVGGVNLNVLHTRS